MGTRKAQHYEIKDDPAILDFFEKTSALPTQERVQRVLSNIHFWGQDLTQQPGLLQAVTDALHQIEELGMAQALINLQGGE